jgi:hypothetical protein
LSLKWSASSGLSGVSFNPASSTLLPRHTIRVQIRVPQHYCPTKGTFTFTGPANTVTVSWSCFVG